MGWRVGAARGVCILAILAGSARSEAAESVTGSDEADDPRANATVAWTESGPELGYTRQVGARVSLGARVLYMPPVAEPYGWVGGGVDALYWREAALRGLFVGAYHRVLRIVSNPLGVQPTWLEVGLVGGWRWELFSQVNLGGGVGVGAALPLHNAQRGGVRMRVRPGVTPRFRLDLGYRF